MRGTKALIMATAVSILGASPASGFANPQANMDIVNAWLTSPNTVWHRCDKPNLLDPSVPYFAFSDPLSTSPRGVCLESRLPVKTEVGFHAVDYWWVQVITNLSHVNDPNNPNPMSECTGSGSCLRDVIRVCLPYYVKHTQPQSPLTLGPCQTGVGKKGCEICTTVDHSNTITN
jgi:hypothetical protein